MLLSTGAGAVTCFFSDNLSQYCDERRGHQCRGHIFGLRLEWLSILEVKGDGKEQEKAQHNRAVACAFAIGGLGEDSFFWVKEKERGQKFEVAQCAPWVAAPAV